MTSKPSDTYAPVATAERPLEVRPLKILIAGGFAVGKTTFVDAISEITPLTTEAAMTSLSIGVDDLAGVPDKTTTTVAMDFGRLTLSASTMLYLFGTPGQDRFWFMWDELVRGAVGAVVLVDTRRLADCFGALDFFDQRSLPYVVALNMFDGQLEHETDEVREALSLAADIPVITTDARNQAATKETLITLVEHAILRKRAAS